MIPLTVRQSITRCLPRDVQHRLATELGERRDRLGADAGVLHPELQRGLSAGQPARPRAAGHRRAGEDYRRAGRSARGRSFGALINPAAGQRCADAVHVMDETFPGPERQHLPDVVIAGTSMPRCWTGSRDPPRAWSPAAAAIRRRPSTPATIARARSFRPWPGVRALGSTAGTSSTWRPRSRGARRRSGRLRRPPAAPAWSEGSDAGGAETRVVRLCRSMTVMCGIAGLIRRLRSGGSARRSSSACASGSRIAAPTISGDREPQPAPPRLSAPQHHRPVAGRPHADARRSGRFSIIYNGEIYNFVELRDGAGASSATASARAPTPRSVLHAFIEWGETACTASSACSPSRSTTQRTR